MDKIYIIGDVHGSFKTLKALLEKIPDGFKVVFTGDLVDRGKNSKEVVELIRSTENYFSVQGNHDYSFARTAFNVYGKNGSIVPKFRFLERNSHLKKSYKQYKGDLNLFYKHREYLRKLPIFLIYKFKDAKDLIVSHSLILDIFKGEDISLYSEQEIEIIQNRHIVDNHNNIITNIENINHNDYYNVFGHTGVFEEPYITDSFSCIDTGGVFKDGGKLTALEYPSMKLIQQENIED